VDVSNLIFFVDGIKIYLYTLNDFNYHE